MNENLLGFTILLLMFLTLISLHLVLSESNCQQEHNIADCKWVLVPSIPVSLD
jgi:hypothetical protein